MRDRKKAKGSAPTKTRPKTRKNTSPKRPSGGRGGWRPGAGRKPKGAVAGVGHRTRSEVPAHLPVLVTLKLKSGLPRLRQERCHAVLRGAFAAGCDQSGFRLVHYALLQDGVHLLVEAENRVSLSRGLQGLKVRMAKKLNRLWGQHGSIFADRYDDRILRTPQEVRSVLCGMLANGKESARQTRSVREVQAADMFSSGPWFDGWRTEVRMRGLEDEPTPVVRPRTRLLATGWRRLGLLGLPALPAGG